jgi:hypothetical protein
MVPVDETDADLGSASHLITVQTLMLARRLPALLAAKPAAEIRVRGPVMRAKLKARRHWMTAARRRVERGGEHQEEQSGIAHRPTPVTPPRPTRMICRRSLKDAERILSFTYRDAAGPRTRTGIATKNIRAGDAPLRRWILTKLFTGYFSETGAGSLTSRPARTDCEDFE